MAVKFAKRRTKHGDAKGHYPKLSTIDLVGRSTTLRHGRYSNLYTASVRPPRQSSFEVTPRLGPKTYNRFALK